MSGFFQTNLMRTTRRPSSSGSRARCRRIFRWILGPSEQICCGCMRLPHWCTLLHCFHSIFPPPLQKYSLLQNEKIQNQSTPTSTTGEDKETRDLNFQESEPRKKKSLLQKSKTNIYKEKEKNGALSSRMNSPQLMMS